MTRRRRSGRTVAMVLVAAVLGGCTAAASLPRTPHRAAEKAEPGPRYFDPARVITLDGPSSEEGFGTSPLVVGDVDADGFNDLLVGAPSADINGSDSGRIYLFRGSADGVSPTPDPVLDGPSEGAGFGATLKRAGDVDGDGRADVLVGWDDGTVSLHRSTGDAFDAAPTWTGEASTAAADFDCDGIGDLAVLENTSLFLYRGTAEGPSVGEAVLDLGVYGAAGRLATAGDVDGDGCDDLAYGTDGHGLVLAGATDTPGRLIAHYVDFFTSDGVPYTFQTILGAGDVNGDGDDDLILAYNLGSDTLGWTSYWLSTRPVIDPDDPDDLGWGLGAAPAGPAGDLDGDGYHDLWSGYLSAVYGGTPDPRDIEPCLVDYGAFAPRFLGPLSLDGDETVETALYDDSADGSQPGHIHLHFGYPSEGTECWEGEPIDTGDTGTPDSGPHDTGTHDTGIHDSGPLDTARPDSSPGETADTGGPPAREPCGCGDEGAAAASVALAALALRRKPARRG